MFMLMVWCADLWGPVGASTLLVVVPAPQMKHRGIVHSCCMSNEMLLVYPCMYMLSMQ